MNRKAAVLTDYVFSLGLRLSLQLEEFFEEEVRPIIDGARTPRERVALEDGWRVVHGARTGMRRYFEKGKITLAKERLQLTLLRRLRSFEFIAVGRFDALGQLGPPALIAPRRWDSLILTWGSDTATDDLAVIHGIHVARVDRLGEAYRRDLVDLLYRQSSESFATDEGKEVGRPPRQRAMVQAWIEAMLASPRAMPAREDAARALAIRHFDAHVKTGKLSEETIRKTIKAFYKSKT